MIKLKKLLAGVLGAAMMLTSMTALAEETSTAMPTIDKTKTGSLTIHKYEYNETGGDATGDAADEDSVSEDAVKLAGVTFKITKVADLTEYYGTDTNKLPTVEAAAKMEPIGDAQEKITNANGEAVFEGLSLGLYLVQETAAPAQITDKVADFLVSIPMTNSTGNDWLYDVHVFPKNSSTYAEVTLLKQGKVGDDNEAALAGATFVLQKKDVDAEKWTTVTANNKGTAIGIDGTLTTDSNGKITVSDLAPGTYRFVETGVPTKTGFIMDGAAVKEFVITTEGNVEINGEETDTTQNPITVINYKPDLEKEVKDRTDGTWGNDSDYSENDIVPYRVKVDVPANVDQLEEFALTDTMVRQTFKSDSLKIYSDEYLTNQILNYVVPTVSDDAKTWNISFSTSQLSKYAGTSIYIYFETVLAADAVTTEEGNPNTVKLEYSNEIIPSTDDGNPNEPENPEEPNKDSISDQATVYTFKIAVEKVDADDITNKLQDVEFDLYRELAEDATGDNVRENPVEGLTGKYELVGHYITNENGQIEENRLENGTYYLVETKTNEGYNLLKAPVEVKIEASYRTETATSTVTENGVTTTTTIVINNTFTNAGDNGVISTTVKNRTGFQLPATGGMGSVIFMVGGIALAMAGILIILASRKKTAA